MSLSMTEILQLKSTRDFWGVQHKYLGFGQVIDRVQRMTWAKDPAFVLTTEEIRSGYKIIEGAYGLTSWGIQSPAGGWQALAIDRVPDQ